MGTPLKKIGSNGHPIKDLIELMRRLREPKVGCPWDLEQDFKSIAPYTIEEAYEVADAIARNDMNDLREELGDLLLQPIYHAQMAAENGHFTFEDVVKDVVDKMEQRHPHVFGDLDAASAQDVNAIWDQRKKEEKAQSQTSAIDGVTLGLPALLRSQKLQKKAAKTGFEWTEIKDILAKLKEELAELHEAIEENDKDHISEELGDVMFVLTNIARKYDINAETALRDTNTKFERRFRGLEKDLKDKDIALSDASLDDMIKGWVHQKQKEKRT